MTSAVCYPPSTPLGQPRAPHWAVRMAGLLVWMTYLVIVLGAATRVWDAGLSCPDWPHCYGVWWPWPEARVAALNQVGYVVHGFHYAAYQVFLEWTHRLCAALVGILLLGLVPTVVQLRSARVPLLATFVLLALQIKLGAITVWLGNIHWTVALHLGNAMLLLACILLLRGTLAASGDIQISVPDRWVWGVAGMNALLIWITMMVGAFVSSAHAGGLCGGLADCNGVWWPDELGQRMHMLHRALAVGVVVWSMVLMIVIKRRLPGLRPSAVWLHGMVWGQAVLGISTLYSFARFADAYRALSLTHLAWGTVVFMVSVGVLLRLRFGDAGRWHA